MFKRKYHGIYTLNTNKAKLITKDLRRNEGVNYFDMYAPVARITKIRVLFALVYLHGLIIHQMDIKKALLNGDLNEEIYIEQL